MQTVNIKSTKKCAFCKHWYDPTNSAIEPKAPNINLWRFDEKKRCKCLKRNIDRPAFATCSSDYECKLEIQGR